MLCPGEQFAWSVKVHATGRSGQISMGSHIEPSQAFPEPLFSQQQHCQHAAVPLRSPIGLCSLLYQGAPIVTAQYKLPLAAEAWQA